uniref:Rap-GAP domain-containing protein n=1 Tax=Parastrongyloides trichosuri TaxID=131310 RepID=A0A0N4ZHF0_PARTI
MYEDCSVIEFTPCQRSILESFSRESSPKVASVLIKQLSTGNILLENESHLEWAMQAINYAFTLRFDSNDEAETTANAVKVYTNWASSMKNDIGKNIPEAFLLYREKYFVRILEAFRKLFIPDNNLTDAQKIKLIDNQNEVLKSIQDICNNCSEEYKEHVWSNSLSFMLQCTNQMCKSPCFENEQYFKMINNILDSLFEQWVIAANQDCIPSLSYWKTLTELSRQFTHHIQLAEIWGNKILNLTSVIYKTRILNKRENSISLPFSDELNKTQDDIFLQNWFKFLNILAAPSILHESADSISIHNFYFSNKDIVSGYSNLLLFANNQQSLSFFITACTLSFIVDIFYGDRIDNEGKVFPPQIEECNEKEISQSKKHPFTKSSLSLDMSNDKNFQLDSHHDFHQPTNNTTVLKPKKSAPFGTNGKSYVSQQALNGDAVVGQHSNLSNHSVSNYENKLKEVEDKLTDSTNIDNNYTSSTYTSSINLTTMSTTSMYENSNNQAMSQRSFPSATSTSRSSSTNEILNGSSGAGHVDTNATPRTFSSGHVIEHDDNSLQNSPDVHVTSICAGKAMALAALCKIVTSKLSAEIIPDFQLAKFYAALHDALVERDRLVLCTLIHNTTNLYNLGLTGVEILLPNYIKAIDIIMTESMKLQLHPSISQIDMRFSCLKALGCVISWPTIFGDQTIIPDGTNPFAGCNSQNNIVNNLSIYDDMKGSILNILIHALRNETDANNLCFVLSLCSIFYEECSAFDLQAQKEKTSSTNSVKSKSSIKNNDPIDSNMLDEEKLFCRSAVRGIVSAVCDNICKPQWSSDRNISIAAMECINAIPSLHVSIIFDKKDISTASLIVTSLCRFIDNQLMKPPMFHSKDLHSTVVAAYNSLNVWLCAAPALMETETCLNKVAKTIELGLTGGKNLDVENYNPASQRVRDAADCLLQHVFSSVSSVQVDTLVDERRLLLKYGPSFIDTTKFKHFVINHSTLMSIHEAYPLSGFVSVFIVIRTPTKVAHSYFLQLEPRSKGITSKFNEIEKGRYTTSEIPALSNISQESVDIGSRTSSFGSSVHTSMNKLSIETSSENIDTSLSKRGSITNEIKQFAFPSDFFQPLCRLDEVNSELVNTKLTEKNINDIKQIRDCLNKGQSPIGNRSVNNKWISEESPKNDNGFDDKVTVNSISTFLYEMGLLNEDSYNKDLIQLDSGQCDQFYKDLHNIVDKSPVRIPQTVNIYYVKQGQQSINDILNNANNIPNLDCDFIYMLSDLGDGIQTKSHPFWTGDWNTAYSADRKPIIYGDVLKNYCLDGIEYALYWSDNMMEFAFITPSPKSYKVIKNSKNPLLNKNNTNSSGTKKVLYTDIKVMIVWLEKLEDIDNFPLLELSNSSSLNTNDFIAIFLINVEEDLIEVRIRSSNIKTGKPGPLLDGVSISKYSLASLLRNTVFNMTRRNIIEFDNYQSLILKRKLAIQDFAKKYSLGISYQEFLNRILTDI